MLQTVYRNLVCKQWDLAYVTISSSSLCSVIVVAVRSLCVADQCTVTWCVSSGTWPTSLTRPVTVIVVAVRSLCVTDCVRNQWDLAYVIQLVQSVFCDCGSSEVPVPVIVVAVRSLCVADCVQEPGV